MSLTKRANKTVLTKLIAAGTTYGFAVLLARVMTPGDFGQVAFFLNAALLLSVVGACGQQAALVRFVPALQANTDHGELQNTTAAAFQTTAIGTILTYFLIVATTAMAKKFGHLQDYSSSMVFGGFALLLMVGWSDIQSHLARGFHKIQLSLIPKEILWRSGAAVLIVIGLGFRSQDQIDAESVIVILLVTLALINLVQGRMLQSVPSITSLVNRITGPALPAWRRTVTPFWITSVSNIFLANADVVCVGLFLGSKNAGLYFAANRLALLLAFFMTSYNIVIGPMLSEEWKNGSGFQVQSIVLRTTLRTTLPTAFLGMLLILFAPQLLCIFGNEFSSAAPVLRILAVAGILNAATGPADIALNMCGFERTAMQVSTIALILSAGFLIIGAVYGGVLGVALAVFVATAFRKLMFWRAATVHMAMRTDIFAALAHTRTLRTAI